MDLHDISPGASDGAEVLLENGTELENNDLKEKECFQLSNKLHN